MDQMISGDIRTECHLWGKQKAQETEYSGTIQP